MANGPSSEDSRRARNARSDRERKSEGTRFGPRWGPMQWLLIFGAMIFGFQYFTAKEMGHPIPYSDFQQMLAKQPVDHRLDNLVVTERMIRGEEIDPKTGERHLFFTNRVDPELARELAASGVRFSQIYEEGGFWSNALLWLPFLLFVPLLFRLFSPERSKDAMGLLPFGRSRAKIYMETETKVTFDDVAGADEAKAELREVVDFLKNPQGYGQLGAHMPRGVLLIGPPGTGKTLLAKAAAGEACVPFYSINGSEFVEMFVGIGAARVRDLFTQARERSPCLIFIDELDALGRSRMAAGVVGGNDEKEQTLNQLLSELDGFDARDGIVLLAATNRPEILDPALLRAGRFDRQILVDRPDRRARLEILQVHAKKVPLAPETDLDEMAGLTPGFTGADLANLVNEAALTATRRHAVSVDAADFTQALERIIAGLERRNRLLHPKERKMVAYHEMGHALVSASQPTGERIHKVSIIPRGIGSLGYTIQRPTEDRYLMTQDELESKMTVLLAGRAAEELVFNQISTGAADDIAKATDIAKSMVMSYGMESRLGPVAYVSQPTAPITPGLGGTPEREPHSEQTQIEIDNAVRGLVNRAFNQALRILRHNRALLGDAAEILLGKETLTAAELEPLFLRLSKLETPSPVPGLNSKLALPDMALK